MKVDNGNLVRKAREKKLLRMTANRFGLCFFIVLAIQFVCLNFFESTMFLNKVNALILNFFSWTIPYFLMLKFSNKNLAKTLSLNKPSNYSLQYFFMGLAFSYIAAVISALIVSLLKIVDISSVTPSNLLEYENTKLGVLIFLVEVAVFPAIVEEFVFRGVLLGCLRDYGDRFAIIVSSIVFGLFHCNIEQITFAFLLGLVLAFVVVKTNSLLISILIHFANNFRSCLVKIISDNMNLWFKSIIIWIIVVVCVLPGLIYYFKLRKNDSEAVNFEGLNSGKTILRLGEKVKCIIFNPGMILWLMYIIYATAISIKAGVSA